MTTAPTVIWEVPVVAVPPAAPDVVTAAASV
jgi:hypothetical protein